MNFIGLIVLLGNLIITLIVSATIGPKEERFKNFIIWFIFGLCAIAFWYMFE